MSILGLMCLNKKNHCDTAETEKLIMQHLVDQFYLKSKKYQPFELSIPWVNVHYWLKKISTLVDTTNWCRFWKLMELFKKQKKPIKTSQTIFKEGGAAILEEHKRDHHNLNLKKMWSSLLRKFPMKSISDD